METKLSKLSVDEVESEGEMASDVLEEAPLWLDFEDEVADPGPEVAWVVGAAVLAGGAEWLAGVSPHDAIHRPTPRLASEGVQIRPNRRWIQGTLFHARSQDVAGECFVFNAADDARSWERHPDALFESPDSGTDGQNPRGI